VRQDPGHALLCFDETREKPDVSDVELVKELSWK